QRCLGVPSVSPVPRDGETFLLDASPETDNLEEALEARMAQQPLDDAGADGPGGSGERVDDDVGEACQVDTDGADDPREHDADQCRDERAQDRSPRVSDLRRRALARDGMDSHITHLTDGWGCSGASRPQDPPCRPSS